MCQVSTTLFRAFFFAGLPILERHAHSYQVAYYKPPGLDAAVIQPYKDLKVLNDTPGALWIQASVQEGRLRFHLFGTKDREVAWEGPFITDRKPPPPGDPRPHPPGRASRWTSPPKGPRWWSAAACATGTGASGRTSCKASTAPGGGLSGGA